MNNICLSGGAAGADIAWGVAAKGRGHSVVHWSFVGHKASLTDDVYILTEQQLKMADDSLTQANKSLKRWWPTNKPWIDNLLRRNYWQIVSCESVYAVSIFNKDKSLLKVNGGTAWALQMYVDRCLFENINPNMYLFEQNEEGWYSWKNRWEKILLPPIPSGIYAGIGTRQLSSNGLNAILDVYS